MLNLLGLINKSSSVAGAGALVAALACGYADAAALNPLPYRPTAFPVVACASATAKLPTAVAHWATIYCTAQHGQIFAYRDGYFSIFPGNSRRFSVNAEGFGGTGKAFGKSFTKVSLTPLKTSQLAAYFPKFAHVPDYLGKAHRLDLLTLTVDNGDTASMIVADETQDPFWVQPVNDHRPYGQPCYIISLALLNKMH